jgi:hypothetical protein
LFGWQERKKNTFNNCYSLNLIDAAKENGLQKKRTNLSVFYFSFDLIVLRLQRYRVESQVDALTV